MTKKLIQW